MVKAVSFVFILGAVTALQGPDKVQDRWGNTWKPDEQNPGQMKQVTSEGIKMENMNQFRPTPDPASLRPQAEPTIAPVTQFRPSTTPSFHRLIDHPRNRTLRDWIHSTKCLNLASQPLMNTQFAQLGALDAINDAGLMDKVTGLSGVSSGAFVMALAASANFSENSRRFREIWPGWNNIVPQSSDIFNGENAAIQNSGADPHLSNFYKSRVLRQVLPASFEELQKPLGIVAVAYADEPAAAAIDGTRAEPMVVSDGNLADAVVASSSAMMGPGCPRCQSGFQAKDFRGHWPVADGFLKDEYGTLGLAALDHCPNLLHVQPQNFAQQLTPTKNANLDLSPTNVVSLGIDVPSSGIMSMLWDKVLQPVNSLRKLTLQGSMQLGSMANQDEIWEKMEYEAAYDHMTEMLDMPMKVYAEDNEQHYFVDLNLRKHWDQIRGWGERKWDQKFDKQHADYWDQTAERRNIMVHERNLKLKSGELSFKKCGNGKGAPRCGPLGRYLPLYYKGQPTIFNRWRQSKGPDPSPFADPVHGALIG